MDFTARYILIKAPTTADVYAERLKAAGKDEAAVKAIAESSAAVVPESAAETFDVMIESEGEAEQAVSKLSEYVFGKEGGEGEDKSDEKEGDVSMGDAPVEGGEEAAAS